MKYAKIIGPACLLVLALIVLLLPKKGKQQYFSNQGLIFGTYYRLTYEATDDLEAEVLQALEQLDESMSMFNDSSIIARINRNEEVETDSLFEAMWREAEDIYRLSEGAFDPTVAPLVNLWGFGRKNRVPVSDEQVDSLLPFVGMDMVRLENHRILKQNPNTMLDAGAVAKGQACDLAAQVLAQHGCTNYLVDIGGEVVAHGKSEYGRGWRIGITKPEDDVSATNQAIMRIVETEQVAMATSGNYRNFYYDGNQKRSHTIDPRTGRPVQHSLLSATVVASSCMRADALATASMVLGVEEALKMIEAAGDAKAYFIVADGEQMRVVTSQKWDLNP